MMTIILLAIFIIGGSIAGDLLATISDKIEKKANK